MKIFLPASGSNWFKADSLPRRTCNKTGKPAAICSLLTSIVSAMFVPYWKITLQIITNLLINETNLQKT